MLKLTRAVAVLWAAVVAVVVLYFGDPVGVVVTVVVQTAANLIANVTKDGTWYDAVFSGLAMNVAKKTNGEVMGDS